MDTETQLTFIKNEIQTHTDAIAVLEQIQTTLEGKIQPIVASLDPLIATNADLAQKKIDLENEKAGLEDEKENLANTIAEKEKAIETLTSANADIQSQLDVATSALNTKVDVTADPIEVSPALEVTP